MKIVKPSYRFIREPDWDDAPLWIEEVARTCYKSHHKITEGSAEKLCRQIIAREHEAMLEFGPDITVVFCVDRGVSHEAVRHRHCSFAQESTRYVKYDGEMEFILPCWFGTEKLFDYYIWEDQMKSSELAYQDLIRSGWAPQQARSVLPNSLKTEIVVKTNIRDWRHIFSLRCDLTAHPQMREVMIPLCNELKEKCPILFDSVTFD